MSANIHETLDAIIKAQETPLGDEPLKKAGYDTTTGINAYDLEPGAKTLYPVLSPILDNVPVVPGGGDTSTRWKAVTAINSGKVRPGVSEGNRGAVLTDTVVPFEANYVTLGLEHSVTFEGEQAARGFDDARGRATESLLRSFIIAQELQAFGGNQNVLLGTTPTPTVANAGTGGTIAEGTYNVVCVALTLQGFKDSSLANGVVQTISKTNADGTTDTLKGGAAKKSDAASTSTTGTTSTISASVTPVRGAVGYAWYVGAAGSEKLEAITQLNSVKLTALAGTGQALTALGTADLSADADYNINGLLYWALKSDSGAYFKALATGTAGTGSKLTSDGAGGVLEISDLFQTMWDNYKIGPDEVWMHSTELRAINALVGGSSGQPLIHLTLDATKMGQQLVAGVTVGYIQNPMANKFCAIRVHPDAVQGTMLFNTKSIPYPLNGVQDIFRIKAQRDTYQLEWPLKSRKYEFGIYRTLLTQHYFAPALGVLTNIAK